MSIKARIILIGILAVGGLGFLLLGLVATEWSRYRQQQQVAHELTMVDELSALVHELQKERGRSAGLLAVAGSDHRRDLETQQAATDRSLVSLVHRDRYLGEQFRQRLTEVRQRVMAGEGRYPQEYRHYSDLVEILLDQVGGLARSSNFARLKDDLVAHSHLMFTKEYLGRGRATIHHGLRSEGWGWATAAEAARLQALFGEYRRQFKRDANRQMVTKLERILRSPEAETVLAVLEATARAEFAVAEGVAAEWFELSTGVIDRLKELEDLSLSHLLTGAEQQLAALRARLLLFALGTLLIGGGILGLTIYTLYGLLRSFDRLLGEVEHIGSRRDFSRRLPVCGPREIGIIAGAFNELLEVVEKLLREKDLLAGTDQLTGLNNRRRFREILDQELLRQQRYPEPLSLVIFDIDHFKQVNDTHGHEAGDLVLKELAQLLGANVRRSDTPARWGGEEFLILLPATNDEAATALAEKLRLAIEQHDFPGVGRVTASFGVASLLGGESDESKLLRRVDKALYRAKQQGRNRVVRWPGD